MSVRDDLIKACEQGDELAIYRTGHGEFYEALRDWWWSRDAFRVKDFAPYARALGDSPPADVMAALPDVAGKWRPHPGEIVGAVRNRQRGDDHRTDVGRCRDRSRSADALAATRAALAAGETVCTCPGPSSRKWVPDGVEHRTGKNGRRISLPVGVWRCPDCRGVEPGQVNAAEDALAEQEAQAV